LLKHLNNVHGKANKLVKLWIKNFKVYRDDEENWGLKISANTIRLVRFFLRSNSALDVFDDPDLKALLPFRSMGKKTFKYKFLPKLVEKVKQKIDEKLKAAESITLISDIWSNPQMKNFLGLCACFMKRNFNTETLVLGMFFNSMARMLKVFFVELTGMSEFSDLRRAEDIQDKVNEILGDYHFDKSKIRAISCDEGSNFVKAFASHERILCFDDDDDDDDCEEDREEEEEDNQDAVEEDDEEHEEDPCFEDVDREVLLELNAISTGRTDLVTREIGILSSVPCQPITNLQNIDESLYDDQYDLTKGTPIRALTITIRTTIVARYSCANHKLNISIRQAVLEHEYVLDMLKTLSSFAATTRRSIQLSRVHRELKASLRSENDTRWGSSFQMIMSFIKANKAGVFTDEHECPYSIDDLSIYFQILYPLYKMNLVFQCTDSSIAEVVPLILLTIHGLLERMDLQDPAAEFRDLLVHHLKAKFNYELNSKCYNIAAILKTSKLHTWIGRSFGREYFKKALNEISEVYLIFHDMNQTRNSTVKTKEPLVNTQMTQETDRVYSDFTKSASFNDLREEKFKEDIKGKLKNEKKHFETMVETGNSRGIDIAAFWDAYERFTTHEFSS
jgi:hypothetical protein